LKIDESNAESVIRFSVTVFINFTEKTQKFLVVWEICCIFAGRMRIDN